jgi:hypothetical protein
MTGYILFGWIHAGGIVFYQPRHFVFMKATRMECVPLCIPQWFSAIRTMISMLSCTYEMEYSGLKPTISKVEIGSIDRTLIVYEHVPTKGCLPPDLDRRQQHPLRVLVVKPRNAWAEIWIKWHRWLKDKNDNREEEGKGFYHLHTRIWTYSNLSDGAESNRHFIY